VKSQYREVGGGDGGEESATPQRWSMSPRHSEGPWGQDMPPPEVAVAIKVREMVEMSASAGRAGVMRSWRQEAASGHCDIRCSSMGTGSRAAARAAGERMASKVRSFMFGIVRDVPW